MQAMMDDREVKRDDLRRLLSRMMAANSGPRLGDLATEMGLISEADLRSALAVQANGNGRRPLLGQVLVEQGTLDERQVKMLVDEQHRIAMSASDQAEADDDALQGIAARLRAMREKG